jgi:threonine dehydratase
MYDAFQAGAVVPSPDLPTICDGLAGETEPAAFEAVRAVLDDLRLVEEDRVPDAIRELYRNEGLVVEGAGAVGVAAALAGALPGGGAVVIVLSGGNIDGERLARILVEE